MLLDQVIGVLALLLGDSAYPGWSLNIPLPEGSLDFACHCLLRAGDLGPGLVLRIDLYLSFKSFGRLEDPIILGLDQMHAFSVR